MSFIPLEVGALKIRMLPFYVGYCCCLGAVWPKTKLRFNICSFVDIAHSLSLPTTLTKSILILTAAIYQVMLANLKCFCVEKTARISGRMNGIVCDSNVFTKRNYPIFCQAIISRELG